MFELHNKDMKQTWKFINQIIAHKTNMTNGSNTTIEQTQCEKLNVYFTNVGKTFSSKLKPTLFSYKPFLKQPFTKSFFLVPTDPNEIQFLISSLKNKNTTSSHDIPTKFLKLSNNLISSWLANYFNHCMTEGEFPDLMKIAQVTPVPKIPHPSKLTDYRPISVLPSLSKVFEKILYRRIYHFLTENNLLTPHQYGFRTNYSTEMAITAIHDKLLKTSDDKLIICAIFLDLSKAFDHVNRISYYQNCHTTKLEEFPINRSLGI